MVLQNFLIVFLAYMVGAIPFGLIFASAFSGVDPRQHGSGNIGATNVLRTSGKMVGLLTLVADIAKGSLPVGLALHFADEPAAALAAAAAFLGHIFPVYLCFRGGKGVATMFGVMLPWQPWLAAGAFVVWLVVLAASRYVSVASMAAGLSLPLLAWQTGVSAPCLGITVLLCLVMITRHHANIRRLVAGTESKVGRKPA